MTADFYGLKEVAGMGLRKATEFLLKDYFISIAKDDTEIEEIKKEKINSQKKNTISRIQDIRLRNFAKRVIWLGNDATHYQKLHTDYDYDELKKFFNILVKHIDQEIDFQSALNIESSKS